MAYYITGNAGNGKYYYKMARDYLSALLFLDEARHVMPGEDWKIVPYKV